MGLASIIAHPLGGRLWRLGDRKGGFSVKNHTKNVIRITCNGKTKDFDRSEEAESVVALMRDIGLEAKTEHTTIEVKEIEKGDKVHWLHNGKPDTERTDIVTDIKKDIYGDRRFLTREINGNRRGMAYESDLVLVG
jgi:hypothetical protein